MYSGISEGKSFREQLAEERKELLRVAVFAYLCSEWYRSEGHLSVDLMADTVPEGLEIDAKDWPEAREFLLDIKDRDLSAFYPENSGKFERPRTSIVKSNTNRNESLGEIKFGERTREKLCGNEEPSFIPEVTKPAIYDEIDDLDLLVKRRLKYKRAGHKQDCRLTQTPSPDDKSSTLRNQTGENETDPISPGREVKEKGNMAPKMTSQVDPRFIIHAGTTCKHAIMDTGKHQDNKTMILTNVGQPTATKTEENWTLDQHQMEPDKPHTESSTLKEGQSERVEPKVIQTPGNTDQMKHKPEHGDVASCWGYQPSFATTMSTKFRKADSQKTNLTKKACPVDTLTVARKMKEFLPPCRLANSDNLLNGVEGRKIENIGDRAEEGQKTKQSRNLTDSKEREADEQHKKDSAKEKKQTDCVREDREEPENSQPDWKRKKDVRTEEKQESPKANIRRQNKVVRPPHRLPDTRISQPSPDNGENPRYKLQKTGSTQVVPETKKVNGCRRRQRKERPLSVRKRERSRKKREKSPEMREMTPLKREKPHMVRQTETKSVERPSSRPTPVEKDSFRAGCARYVRYKVERFRQIVISFNCVGKVNACNCQS